MPLSSSYPTTNPWHHTGDACLTSGAIDMAIQAGGTRLEVYQAVLEAVDTGNLEDASACAFVALGLGSTKYREGV